MTYIEIIRMFLAISAAGVATLWVIYGKRSRKWLWPAVALCWLVPVALFFGMRFVIVVQPVTLNLISQSLYLMAIYGLGGVALAKLKTQGEKCA